VKLLSLSLVLAPVALSSQEPDPRWLPWLGCWQVRQVAEPGVPLVCLRPGADPLSVEVASVAGGEVGFTQVFVADARPHEVTVGECAGTQVTSFSADGERVFLHTTLTCADGSPRAFSGIMSMASPDVWLDVQAAGVGEERVARVLRYDPAPILSWPAPFVFSAERADFVATARVAAAARLSLLDVREAASQTDPQALAALLVERNQRFDLDAATLAALDDAGVPGPVVDALMAVSYPQLFTVMRDETRAAPRTRTPVAPAPAPGYPDPYPWGWWGYGSCFYSAFCSGYSGFWPYNGGTGITIVMRGREVERPRATASSSGYAHGGQPTGSTAKRRGEPGSASTSSGFPSSYGNSGGGSSTGGSASPGGYSRSGGGSSSGGSAGSAQPRRN
jgi:hypothetical protein